MFPMFSEIPRIDGTEFLVNLQVKIHYFFKGLLELEKLSSPHWHPVQVKNNKSNDDIMLRCLYLHMPLSLGDIKQKPRSNRGIRYFAASTLHAIPEIKEMHWKYVNFVSLREILGLQCNPKDNLTGGDLLCNSWNYAEGGGLELSLSCVGGHGGTTNKVCDIEKHEIGSLHCTRHPLSLFKSR